MSTLVTGPRARSVRSDTFADITIAPLIAIRPDGLEFDGDLDEAQIEAIRRRMAGDDADDAEEAKRADLVAKRDAAHLEPSIGNVAVLLEALTNYTLGE